MPRLAGLTLLTRLWVFAAATSPGQQPSHGVPVPVSWEDYFKTAEWVAEPERGAKFWYTLLCTVLLQNSAVSDAGHEATQGLQDLPCRRQGPSAALSAWWRLHRHELGSLCPPPGYCQVSLADCLDKWPSSMALVSEQCLAT